MQVQIKPLTALLFGVGFVLALAFLLNGRDYSPSKSVASSEHSVVAPLANAETAWQSNSRRSPGPEQVTIQQPPTVIVQLPEGVYPFPANSSLSGELSAPGAGASGTGWRTPDPVTEEDSSSEPSEPKRSKSKVTGSSSSSPDCDALAQRIHDTHDYRGTADERACFGEEDDPRVGLALDYGKTETSYAASEQTLKPGSYGCMLEADGIVADGWQGTAEQVQCFGYDDLAGINEAYGALEEGRTSY